MEASKRQIDIPDSGVAQQQLGLIRAGFPKLCATACRPIRHIFPCYCRPFPCYCQNRPCYFREAKRSKNPHECCVSFNRTHIFGPSSSSCPVFIPVIPKRDRFRWTVIRHQAVFRNLNIETRKREGRFCGHGCLISVHVERLWGAFRVSVSRGKNPVPGRARRRRKPWF